jgi:catechol 2,3-dioxygenase-like lactoylglutathione lyase family enzyme
MDASHIALAVKDIEATHRFHTETMGFDLVELLRSAVSSVETGEAARFIPRSAGSGSVGERKRSS